MNVKCLLKVRLKALFVYGQSQERLVLVYTTL